MVLRRVTPYEDPGYARRRAGKGFVYVNDRGRAVTSTATLDRIRALVIPPAWRDVWISADEDGHIQAAGRDARGRMQYRYHPRWTAMRDAAKYDRLADFCRALPRLRRRVARDLRCRCICRTSVAATVVALLERAHLRIGHAEYVRQNGSYGATTLENRHLTVRGAHIELRYRGKGGIERHIELDDPILARVIARVSRLPGRRVFQYDDGGRPRAITADDVNAYLRDAIGPDFSAKDFRTWAATLRCTMKLAALEPPTSETAMKRAVRGVIQQVAAKLGHTPTICRKSYVHPRVLEAFARGALVGFPTSSLRAAEKALIAVLSGRDRHARLHHHEAAVGLQ